MWVAEMAPDRDFVFEVLLRFFAFGSVDCDDRFTHDLHGVDKLLPAVRDRMRFFDDAKSAMVEGPADDVLVVHAKRLPFVVPLWLRRRFR